MTRTTLSQIEAVQPIQAYEAPQYLIETAGPILRHDDSEFEEGTRVEVIEDNVQGWDGFNAIVELTYPDGGWDHYLAQIREQ